MTPQDKAQAQQYFAQQPQSESAPQKMPLRFWERDLRVWTDRGVFSKGELDAGTQVLLKALPEPIAGHLLDLGCGWGPVGLLVKARYPGAQVTMADVNARAVELARRNLKENQLEAAVVQSDGFDNITERFDLIALNPPIRAGKETVYRLFTGCADHLLPQGRLYVVIRKQQGAPSAKAFLGTLFQRIETLARKGGYHVFCCDGPIPAAERTTNEPLA